MVLSVIIDPIISTYSFNFDDGDVEFWSHFDLLK